MINISAARNTTHMILYCVYKSNKAYFNKIVSESDMTHIKNVKFYGDIDEFSIFMFSYNLLSSLSKSLQLVMHSDLVITLYADEQVMRVTKSRHMYEDTLCIVKSILGDIDESKLEILV